MTYVHEMFYTLYNKATDVKQCTKYYSKKKLLQSRQLHVSIYASTPITFVINMQP